jgi:hypothetical protein
MELDVHASMHRVETSAYWKKEEEKEEEGEIDASVLVEGYRQSP